MAKDRPDLSRLSTDSIHRSGTHIVKISRGALNDTRVRTCKQVGMPANTHTHFSSQIASYATLPLVRRLRCKNVEINKIEKR